MKVYLLPLLVLAAALGSRLRSECGPCCADTASCEDACCDVPGDVLAAEGDAPAADGGVHGQYLEARDATVWGGACHANGESLGQGREGLAAWRLHSGSHSGVDLAGVELLLVVHGSGNLAEPGQRASCLFVDAPDADRREAAVAWLRDRMGDALGDLASVDAAAIGFQLDEAGYRLVLGERVQLTGSALPDDACCTMPELRWYRTLDPLLEHSRVGFAETCSVQAPVGLVSWSHAGQNNVQYGAF